MHFDEETSSGANPPMAGTDIGSRVRALRKRLGLTHEQLAERSGLRRAEPIRPPRK